MKLWIFFAVHHKSGLFWGSFLYILGLFLIVKVQYWNGFEGLVTFRYFWVCLIFLAD